MRNKILNLPEFLSYVQRKGIKDDNIHIVNFEDEQGLLKSDAINIDFYLLSLKPPMHKKVVYDYIIGEAGNSYMFFQSPGELQSWDIEPPSSGFVISLSNNYMREIGRNYSFFHYKNALEAIYLTKEEEFVLWDLYRKAYMEFRKTDYSKDILLSYVALILAYTETFYKRQFQSRGVMVNKVINDFHSNLEEYFAKEALRSGFPSVAYFAEKAFLSTNYFGDLVKHLTDKSATDYIQNFAITLAQQKLLNSTLTVSEISHSLGFEYPNYFARFFRRKTGLSPTYYRKQS